MPDVPLVANNTQAAPKDYTVPLAQEIIVKAVRAAIDGSGAGGAYLPALQMIAPNGDVMWTAVPSSSVAGGSSADVTWFPGVKAAATASGSGIQFDTDNVGGWLQVEETSTVGGNFSQPNAGANFETAFSQAFNAEAGTLFTDSAGNFFNNGNPVVQIVHQITTGQDGGEGIVVQVSDTSAPPGDVSAIGAQISAISRSTVSPAEGLIVLGQINGGGTADAFGVEASAQNSGSGRAVALSLFSNPAGGGERVGIDCIGAVGMHHYLALPLAAGPSGSLWNNGGIVQVAP